MMKKQKFENLIKVFGKWSRLQRHRQRLRPKQIQTQ